MPKIIQHTLLPIFLIALDQLSKYLAAAHESPLKIFDIFCNKNIAWSIQVAPGFFYLLWAILTLSLIYFFWKSDRHSTRVAIIFIMSGSLSNITDRFKFGCVVDFINVPPWPVFNLADVYITIGVIFLLIFNFQFSIFKK